MDHERVAWNPSDYAGVGRRLAAVLLDGLVVTALFVVLTGLPALLGYLVDGRDGAVALGVAGYLCAFLTTCAYHVLLVARHGATLGKRWLGIEVRRIDGTYPGVPMALARFVATQISAMPLYLGYLWALWDDHRRTWHDIICETFVLDARRVVPVPLRAAGGPRTPVHNPLHDRPPRRPAAPPTPAGHPARGGPAPAQPVRAPAAQPAPARGDRDVRVGTRRATDPNAEAIARSGVAPVTAGWLQQVAAQVDPRLDRLAPGWRDQPQAEAARAVLFGLLLGRLARAYPHTTPELSRVVEAHPGFESLLAGSRLATLREVAGANSRVMAWLAPLVGVDDPERFRWLLD